jgi:hypothetical protein
MRHEKRQENGIFINGNVIVLLFVWRIWIFLCFLGSLVGALGAFVDDCVINGGMARRGSATPYLVEKGRVPMHRDHGSPDFIPQGKRL